MARGEMETGEESITTNLCSTSKFNLSPSFCPKISILILDVMYSIYILLYLFKKNYSERNSRNSRFLGNRMFEKIAKFPEIPDF